MIEQGELVEQGPKPKALEPEISAWFVKRLADHRVECEPNKQAIRRAIIEHYLEQVICRGLKGKPMRYTAAFERAFGEPLMPDPTK